MSLWPLRIATLALACVALGGCTGSASTGAGGGGPAEPPLPPPPDDPTAPSGFWDAPSIPAARNVMTFVFLNRTGGTFQDGEVFWRFQSGSISELHSIAEQPTYDMPANASGRMYFYLCGAANGCSGDPSRSPYYDFIEFTIGADRFNGNTTRVDAFGLKLALRLHCADGFDRSVGDGYALFQEDRAATFRRFVAEVPEEFKHLAQAPFAPFRIVEPGAGEFKAGGKYASYYDAQVDALWAANGLTVAKPGPNGSGLGSYPDLSAAIYRHVGATAGTFSPAGKLLTAGFWDDPATFYLQPPANYYARFWHVHGLDGKAYGFPYDDVGGYSTYVSHDGPQYLLVAVGW